ncbi:HDOD domain-containing protein [uncultured Aquincola sp.]|uniref:HDOD domain-containing protein n=1 Tax=uncultured Aquincola sp. TaxID=886556 RepID=UPI0032B10299
MHTLPTPALQPAAGGLGAEATADAFARRLAELPALPKAMAAVMRALGRDSVAAGDCIDAIEHEPGLAARLLRLANSPFYGVAGRVGSVGDAVRLLGLRPVASVVAAVSVQQMLLPLQPEGFDLALYRAHAVATATAARELAPLGRQDAEEAFVAGLLHDVGQLVMALFAPQAAAQARQLSQTQGLSLSQAEQQLLGSTHAAVGATIARHWHLPDTTAEAIARHHQPAGPDADGTASLSAIVHVADALTHLLHSTPTALAALPALPGLSHTAWGSLMADEATLPQLLGRVAEGTALWGMDGVG